MALRYTQCPQVVGYDLRNEVRPTTMMGPSPRWGHTSRKLDWSRAAGACILAAKIEGIYRDLQGFHMISRGFYMFLPRFEVVGVLFSRCLLVLDVD